MLGNQSTRRNQALLTLALWSFAIAGLSLLYAYYISLKGQDQNSFVIGAAGSLGASFIFFLLFEVTFRRPTAEAMATNASDAAVKHVLARLESVPDKVFPPSRVSNQSFEVEFETLLGNSNCYWVKGTSARHTARRMIAEPQRFEGKDVRILLFDSANLDVLADRVRLEGKGDPRVHITNTMETVRMLEQVAKRLGQTLSVRTFSGFPIYRLEVLHDGLFVSFYGTDATFPGSLLYRNNRIHDTAAPSLYRAFHRDFLYSFTSATKLIGPGATEDAVTSFLSRLEDARRRAEKLTPEGIDEE